MGNSQPSLTAFQILMVKHNSPAHTHGLLPFIHYIISINDLPPYENKSENMLIKAYDSYRNTQFVVHITNCRSLGIRIHMSPIYLPAYRVTNVLGGSFSDRYGLEQQFLLGVEGKYCPPEGLPSLLKELRGQDFFVLVFDGERDVYRVGVEGYQSLGCDLVSGILCKFPEGKDLLLRFDEKKLEGSDGGNQKNNEQENEELIERGDNKFYREMNKEADDFLMSNEIGNKFFSEENPGNEIQNDEVQSDPVVYTDEVIPNVRTVLGSPKEDFDTPVNSNFDIYNSESLRVEGIDPKVDVEKDENIIENKIVGDKIVEDKIVGDKIVGDKILENEEEELMTINSQNLLNSQEKEESQHKTEGDNKEEELEEMPSGSFFDDVPDEFFKNYKKKD